MFSDPTIPYRALADGFHCIEGFGSGEKVGDRFYTAERIYYPEGSFVRRDFYGENVAYSKWTDEQRAEERARKEREAKAEKAKAEEEEHKRTLLLDSARAKLTPDEWQAVYDEGYSEGRDY
jgi:hypothetical protein